MNMRKAVAAAFGAALLGAGTSAVVGGPAHGVLSSNSTGKAVNKNSANGATSSATCTDCSASVNAKQTASKVAGGHQRSGHNKAIVTNKVHGGNSSATTKGSAKSGGFKIRIK